MQRGYTFIILAIIASTVFGFQWPGIIIIIIIITISITRSIIATINTISIISNFNITIAI